MSHAQIMIFVISTTPLFAVLLVALLAIAPSGLAHAGGTSYTFAPLPMAQPETVLREFKPMLAHLERETGLALRVVYTRDYGELLRLFREGRVDLAYLGPLPYVALKREYPAAQPLVHFREASGQPSYTCALVGRDDTMAPRAIPRRRVALTQPLSTCGYLATDALLGNQGADLARMPYRYLDTHDQVALSVVRGDFELGGMKTAIARKYAHLGLRILATTEALPGFALIVNGRRVPVAHAEALRQALVRPVTDAASRAARERWGDGIRHGAVLAADNDYDRVRRMLAGKAIPASGNF